MDTVTRRSLIVTESNPGSRLDYLVGLEGHITAGNETMSIVISLRYVPDKRVIVPTSLVRYLQALATMERSSLEDLAVTLLTDINNEAVARWVHVSVSTPASGNDGVDKHMVVIEDRQPKWDNSQLLSRLKKY